MRRQPAQTRSQQKVQGILRAARTVLIERGYENFTTNHVAAASGYNISTVYRYFPEKNEIIKQLYLLWLDDERETNQRVVAGLKPPVDPAEFVAELFRTHLDGHSDADHALSVEMTKALYLNSDVRLLDADYEGAFVQTVSDHLNRYTSEVFSRSQIAFVLKLAVSLLIMISRSAPEDRPELTEMAVESLAATVRSWSRDG